MNEYARAIEALRMSCITAEAVEVDQLTVLTKDLRLALDEIERLQYEIDNQDGGDRRRD